MKTTEDSVHHGKLTKIERYGWKIQDQPGELKMISKNVLLVDHAYQRDAKSQKIQAIASDWSWVAAGTITVADREGSLFVIDGQHRVLAARRRADIADLPCIVFRTAGAYEEAKGFLTAQTKRKAVTAIEQFRAKIVLQDPAALIAQRLIESCGRSVTEGTGGPQTIKCVAELMKFASSEPVVLERLWPLIVDICRGHAINQRLLCGLMFIELHLPDGSSLTDREPRRRLLKAGAEALVNGANKAAQFYNSGGHKVWALGMIEVMNRGCRHRIEMADRTA